MILNKKIIYLAGGFHSGWQKKAHEKLSDYKLLDPSLHKIENSVDYTKWDLSAIKCSDIILANMEDSNPGGYALALEIGYAKALDKVVILVENIKDPLTKKYFEMVRSSSDFIFENIEDAIKFILMECRL